MRAPAWHPPPPHTHVVRAAVQQIEWQLLAEAHWQPSRPPTHPPAPCAVLLWRRCRVGRTARAGRSGRSVTLVTQYDVEPFQKIEHLTGVKMEEFAAPKDEVRAAPWQPLQCSCQASSQ